jgi:hypothetical protein
MPYRTINIVQQPTFAASYTPNMQLGDYVAVGTLTGNITVNAPTKRQVGPYVFRFLQDGTGGRTVTWNAVFKFPTGAWTDVGNTANKASFVAFYDDGTNFWALNVNAWV